MERLEHTKTTMLSDLNYLRSDDTGLASHIPVEAERREDLQSLES